MYKFLPPRFPLYHQLQLGQLIFYLAIKSTETGFLPVLLQKVPLTMFEIHPHRHSSQHTLIKDLL